MMDVVTYSTNMKKDTAVDINADVGSDNSMICSIPYFKQRLTSYALPNILLSLSILSTFH